jgi:hypothetical protein
MRPVTRILSAACLAAIVLSCSEPTAAPDPGLSLHRGGGGGGGGNPDCQLSGRAHSTKHNPVDFLCAIEMPSPLTGSQKGWAEQSNGKYFLTDGFSFGVQVIDIRTHTRVGLIAGMTGNATTGGGTATTNGAGPNAFVSAPAGGRHGHDDGDDDDDRGRDGSKRVLFVSDGNSTVRVVDMNRLEIITSISTAIVGSTEAACDGGTDNTHYCGRSNEIAYDPVHHIVAVQNPNPLSHVRCRATGANCTNNAGITAAGAALEGYLTFISARPPYRVLGHLTFGNGTVEGHVWVPQLNRFLLPMQNPPAGADGVVRPFHAVINARTMREESRRSYVCADIPGTTNAGGNNNLQLAGNNLWAQMCGRPIRLDVRSGAVLNVVTETSTGDQAWFNPGDGNYYNTGNVAGVASLGVMNAFTGAFEQGVANIGGASPSAYAKTNEIFTRVPFNANTAADNRCSAESDAAGRGCVVVFAHVADDNDGTDGGDDDDD